VLFRPSREAADREVVAIGAAAGAQGLALLALLVERVRAGGHRVRIPMISEEEMSFATLADMGFRLERETIGYVAVQTA